MVLSLLSRLWPLLGVLLSSLVFRSGTAVTNFALPWLVYSLTSSSLSTSMAVSCGLIGSVLGSLTGGLVIDRCGPVRVVKVAGMCGALAMGLVPVLFDQSQLTIFTLVALVTCGSLFDATASSAQDSRIPEIAKCAQTSLRRVVAVKSVIGFVAAMGAPLLAALAARRWGTERTLWYSAFCLLLGGALATMVITRCDRPMAARKDCKSFSMWASVATIWRDALLRRSIIVTTSAAAIVGTTSAVIIPALVKMRTGDVQLYGGFISAVAGGSMTGSILYGLVGERVRTSVIESLGFGLICVSLGVLGLFTTPLLLPISGVLLGMAVSPMVASMSVLLYQRIAVEMRGRSLGVVSATMACMTPVAMILVGSVVDRLGSTVILAGLATIAGVVAATCTGLNDSPKA